MIERGKKQNLQIATAGFFFFFPSLHTIVTFGLKLTQEYYVS